MAMRKFLSITFALILSIVFAASTANARSVRDDYDLVEFLNVPVQKIVECVNPYTGELDHRIYQRQKSKFRSDNDIEGWFEDMELIVCCHSVDTGNGSYMIAIMGQKRYDYVRAVEEALEYWERRGVLNVGYIRVILNTCFIGKAPYQQGIMLNNGNRFIPVSLFLSTDYTGRTAGEEIKDAYGNVIRLKLSKAYPKRNNDLRVYDNSSSRNDRYDDKNIVLWE